MKQTKRLTTTFYEEEYARSIKNPEAFWAEQAQQFITWFKPWEQVLTGSFENLDMQWFGGAKLNAAYNCLDRHLQERGNQTAIIWESDDPAVSKKMTYNELYDQVCRFANVLKSLHIKKGDRVCIYLPMIPEAAIAMLACARIGAIHSVVFGGFSAEALKTRILDADCRLVITANEGLRGNKYIPLKKNVDDALNHCPNVNKVIVVERSHHSVSWVKERDIWYHEIMATADPHCVAEMLDANDPLFILYTSGSTGTPKGILHGTGGYLVYAAITYQYIFDYQEQEVYWCTADVGWITGHTYGIYGPLLNGAITVMFEGVPHSPTFARYWEIIDKHQINIFYTAPTAIRALRREGDHWVKQTKRNSLRILGSVGEPLNPEAWEWYYKVVGESRCPIVDTWWQTETGGIMITPLPVALSKPGSVGRPFFGIEPQIINEAGESINDNQMGKLVINKPWPGLMLSIYGNRERFVNSYFKEFPGRYLTGDQAFKDTQGNFTIAGRSDDVIKVSGHRIGTQEVESALILHSAVSEAAVIGIPDDIKGQRIYAFVTLKLGYEASDTLKKELINKVRASIGAIAAPEFIQWAEGLPKTRSGKIMRRILRKIAMGDTTDLGDLSTLADPTVIEQHYWILYSLQEEYMPQAEPC